MPSSKPERGDRRIGHRRWAPAAPIRSAAGPSSDGQLRHRRSKSRGRSGGCSRRKPDFGPTPAPVTLQKATSEVLPITSSPDTRVSLPGPFRASRWRLASRPSNSARSYSITSQLRRRGAPIPSVPLVGGPSHPCRRSRRAPLGGVRGPPRDQMTRRVRSPTHAQCYSASAVEWFAPYRTKPTSFDPLVSASFAPCACRGVGVERS